MKKRCGLRFQRQLRIERLLARRNRRYGFFDPLNIIFSDSVRRSSEMGRKKFFTVNQAFLAHHLSDGGAEFGYCSGIEIAAVVTQNSCEIFCSDPVELFKVNGAREIEGIIDNEYRHVAGKSIRIMQGLHTVID